VEISFNARNDSAQVRMDPERLEIVFRNLLENAIQHSPPRGVVAVEVTTRRDPEKAWIECRLKDSGPGFRPDALGRVFEPFFTLRKGGTGLGLAIVQRIVEEHGGKISVGNRPQGGAVVTIRLPRIEVVAQQESRHGEIQNISRR